MTFATESFDDDGLPHTLEHLIYLGSENYPYKGVLDLVANKCFADGTNACTDTDHTNYTLSTAGSEGFFTILPVYLDHLLFPLMTEEAYMTEVHHITGEGEDAGIVYCEMQATENSGDTRCHQEMLKALYPGKCGYKSNTGGAMHNLRTSTSNEKCRAYHKRNYHPKNLCVIVTGPVTGEEVFRSIKPIEDKVVQRGIHEIKFERPWQSQVPPFPETVFKNIEYPSDTDDDGLVYIGFRGPSAVEDFKSIVALTMLLEYLNSTAVSPIQRDFVECSEPYCSSVSTNIIENSISALYITFEGVDKIRLNEISKKLFEVLNKIATGEEKFDIDRMRTILNRKVIQILSAAETSPHSIVIGSIIGYFLYGNNDFHIRCQEITLLEEFVKKDVPFWLDLLRKYFTSAKYVAVVGQPSPSCMKAISGAEKARVKKQKEDLKDELPILAEKFKSAVEYNERPPPPELISSIKSPSLDRIVFPSISRHVVDDLSQVPFRIQYDYIQTNFITIQVLLDTGKLSSSERLYLPLISELLFESPINRNGTVIPYETIVSELFSDTICYCCSIGISSGSTFSTGTAGNLLDIMMQVEKSKYEKAVQWFYEIIYDIVFTPERIATVATRLHSDISQYKRSGGKVASAAMKSMLFQSNSNNWATNFLRQQNFLKDILDNVKKERSQDSLTESRITKTVEAIFRKITSSSSNIFAHIAVKEENMDSILDTWKRLLPAKVQEKTTSDVTFDINSLPSCKDLVKFCPDAQEVIIPLGSIESNFMRQVVKTPIDSHKHPMLAPLYVLINYLNQIEGPLWRQIRGLGLSYNYSIAISPSEGLIYFSLSKSTNVVGAYSKAVEIVKQYVFNEQYEDSLLETAKSSLIFELVRREKSAADRSIQSLIAYIRGLDIDYNKELIKTVSKVTKGDLKKAGPFLWPLFDSEELRAVVCCNPSKVPEVKEGFSGIERFIKYDVDLDSENFLNSTKLN